MHTIILYLYITQAYMCAILMYTLYTILYIYTKVLRREWQASDKAVWSYRRPDVGVHYLCVHLNRRGSATPTFAYVLLLFYNIHVCVIIIGGVSCCSSSTSHELARA